MSPAIVRLALFQFLAVFYSVLVIGIVLRIHWGSPAPVIFATHLRDHGFLLLFLPGAWFLWATVSMNRPLPGTGDLGPILFSGLLVLAVLLFLAVLGTVSAVWPRRLPYRELITPPAIGDSL